MKRRFVSRPTTAWLLAVLWWPLAVPADDPLARSWKPSELKRVLRHSPLPPVPDDPTNEVDSDPRAVELGERLFFDCRLSSSRAVSCASCHQPGRDWTDGEALSSSFPLDRHVPSLWNAAYNRWFFWDGRADSLWSQALKPLEDPDEHAASREQILGVVRGDPVLDALYRQIFGRPVPEVGLQQPEPWSTPGGRGRPADDQVDRAFANIGKAIAAFVSTLTTRDTRFDRFAQALRDGDPAGGQWLSDAEVRGLKLFVGEARCHLCHSGPTFSDSQFHDIRVRPGRGAPEAARYDGIRQVLEDPFNGLGDFSARRNGTAVAEVRFLRRSPETWGQYKTPTLRNVARTAPYMHQGQLAELESVINHYSTFENALPPGHHEETFVAPLRLSADEARSLAAFLGSLTSLDLADRHYPEIACAPP